MGIVVSLVHDRSVPGPPVQGKRARARERYAALLPCSTTAPGSSFTIDFRHPDKDVLLARGDAIKGVVQAAVRETFHTLPVAFSPLVIDAVACATEAQGYRHMRLPSGAFHDAQFVVPVCPTGMIFVPCRNGISHNPTEYAEPAQLAAGTRVLMRTLIDMANA